MGDLLARILDAARDDVADATEDLPAAAMRQLFDALVCMAAGSGEIPARGAGAHGAATVVGRSLRVEPLIAAVHNAMAAHVDDLDDVHWPSVTHPGSVVWPVLLALAQEHAVARPVLARAGALAYQVTARTAESVGPRHRAAVHATAFAGAVGAAAGAATLLEEDDATVVVAMAHAASVAGGTVQALGERSLTAVVHRGAAASAAMVALSARKLRPAVRLPVDGPGTLLGALGERADDTGLDRRQDPAVATCTTRFHPVTGFAHPLVDCLEDIGEIDPDAIVAIEAVVPAYVITPTREEPPTSAREAHWHLPHAAAAAVCGELGGRRVPWPPGEQLLRVRDRVHVRGRPAGPPDLAVSVEVRLEDGPPRSAHREAPRGHPADPCTDEDRVGKAVRLGVLERSAGDELLAGLVSGGGPISHELLQAFVSRT